MIITVEYRDVVSVLVPPWFVDTSIFCIAKHNPICCVYLAFVGLHVSNKPCLTVRAGAAVVSLRTQFIFMELPGLLSLKMGTHFSGSPRRAPLNTQYEPGGMVIHCKITFLYSVIAKHILPQMLVADQMQRKKPLSISMSIYVYTYGIYTCIVVAMQFPRLATFRSSGPGFLLLSLPPSGRVRCLVMYVGLRSSEWLGSAPVSFIITSVRV